VRSERRKRMMARPSAVSREGTFVLCLPRPIRVQSALICGPFDSAPTHLVSGGLAQGKLERSAPSAALE